jgi:hypothetical protein
MSFVKRNVAAIAVGAVVIVGGSYVGARALTSPQTVTLDSANASSAASPAPQQRGLVRGEGVVARPDGTFPTVQINRGTLASVDGTTLVISEADGTTQRVDTTADTHFRRDGKKASLSDLQPGDHIGTRGEGRRHVHDEVRARVLATGVADARVRADATP